MSESMRQKGSARRGVPGTIWSLVLACVLVALAVTIGGCAGTEDATSEPEATEERTDDVAADIAEDAAFEVREVPVFREELTRETIPLRFYEDQPHVAYVSPADYYRLILPQGTCEMERDDDGVWHLTSHTGADPAHAMEGGLGGEATIDVARGTLTTPDLAAFTNVMSRVQDGMANCYLDGAAYVRVDEFEEEGEVKPQTIDFARYGIALHEDADGVYVPFQTLSMLGSDVHFNYASFNGETVYVNDDNWYRMMFERDPTYFDPILGVGERPADLAEFDYAHLCLVFDYFYGRPGTHFRYGKELDEGGLDGLIESLGEVGTAIKEGLKGRDLAHYLQALDALGIVMDDAGHTAINAQGFTDLLDNDERADLLMEYQGLWSDPDDLVTTFVLARYEGDIIEGYNQEFAFKKLHGDAYGDRTYVVEGDTALIALNSFNDIDYEGWADYLAGRGDRPSPTEPFDEKGRVDSAAIFLDGVERAVADPAVRNVVLDISNNPGGSLDVVAFVRAIITGDTTYHYSNALTHAIDQERFAVDANLDGTFDEKDAGPLYPDLTFAVLIGPVSFSCGNIMPSVLKEDGILVMGTKSQGGSCAVMRCVTADGIPFQMSSWQAKIVDATDKDIDGGIEPDIDLVERFGKGTQAVEVAADEETGYEGAVVENVPDYSAFFDAGLLGQVMDEWYGSQALDEAA